jgi:hypothetical protein
MLEDARLEARLQAPAVLRSDLDDEGLLRHARILARAALARKKME